MRRLALPLLAILPMAVALAAPLAAAQDQPAPSLPSLTLEPTVLDAPGGEANATLVLRNPTASTQRYHLSYETADAVRVLLARENVSVAPGSSERVVAKLRAEDPARGAERAVTFVATSVPAPSASTDAAAPPPLRADLTLRVLPRSPGVAPPAGPLPTGTLQLLTPALTAAPGDTAQGTLLVRNTGTEAFVPELTTNAGPALRFEFATFPALRPGEQVEVPFSVSAVAEAPAGPRRVEIRAVGFEGAPVVLRVDVQPAGAAPPDPTQNAAGANGEPPGSVPASALVAGAAAVGVAGIGAAAWVSRREWWPLVAAPLAALYTRLRPSKLLDHPVRAKLVELVRAQPGITFGELARALGIAPGQLTHHARMLEKARILFSSPDGQTRRFYLIAEGRVAPVAPLAQRALDLVRASPRRASDVARELGVSRQALHYHVKQLAARGEIVARPDGREVWLESTKTDQ